MKKILFLGFKLSMLALSSCTYSINLIHTEGTASDIVDETDSPSLTAQVPLTVPLPSFSLKD